MADPGEVRSIVERVISEALEAHVSELRREVAERVLQEIEALLQAAPGESTTPGGAPTDVLNSAIATIQDVSSQSDILRTLLDGAARFAGRVALFVIRGGTATGWQGRGFANDDAIKGTSVDPSRGLAARAMQDRMPAAAAAAEFSSNFVASFGNPADGNAVVLPLVVKDKVAALLYADVGTGADGRIDPSALHVLVRSTGHWLELLSLRKTAGASEAAPAEAPEAPPPPSVAAPPPPPPPPPPKEPARVEEPVMSPADQELHKKAKRKAKVLVEEIKLYNQAKVTEGRKHKDLYDRLKEDIEKSRAEYEKHFGKTAAADANYFVKELVRILADNDESALGNNFPG
ncbi:MAG TPA: hypothetical protein VNK82_06550 [Terriglobales bacterium]|nr:hypothetical protein [Terriglobales bacterium]